MKQSWTTFNIGNLSGKTAIVTGGNAGLGLATVHQLLMHGADVVVASRSVERGEKAVAGLGPQRGTAEVLQLDLADLASVEAFANAVKARHDKIDLLINNAGIMMTDPAVTKDGFELQLAPTTWATLR
ncbi:SDR family NAD(P)-dependent oxidoreductase [Ornithinimicrobium sp. INDO-MA30-4]|uniref:SDR family NAD(P)-dependent oxidoreductase n=1 Tax=Ornithinimicrobium sp. INDO-MA30-4 TaxID=2908651 RepID=UPI001F2DDC4B|nr:SDR family NAD(P)-dependent oxidoreductase [Ornithinimicrobium sp. INDO-MA30-4]UJH69947.1 SDR family NAD(P)-dependent oxidoreductase [Ornithinimicrobium sp. INDO-MA30-4]